MADGKRESDKKILFGDRVDGVIGRVKLKGVCDTISGVCDGGDDVMGCGKHRRVRENCDERR